MVNIGISGHRNISSRLRARKFVKHCLAMMDARQEDWTIIIGGARGWDTEVMYECYLHDVPYILLFAFGYQRDAINKIYLDRAVTFTVAEEFYNPKKNKIFQDRNKEIVDNSVELHIYWDGRTNGGTYRARNYAIQSNIPVINWF